jgi:hypothetical protein
MKIKAISPADLHVKSDKNREARQSKITYVELFDAGEIFEEDPNARSSSWVYARRFVDWRNLHNLPTEDVKRRVIGFLNNWGCRLPVSDELANNIKEAYRKSIPFLKCLENETLEDFEFENKVNINEEEYINREILLEVFMNFCKIGHNFRGVAASKLLSLINPSLFVMWDTSICEAYGIRAPSEPYIRDKQYVPEFFPLMKEKANGVIDTYMKEKKCSRSEAIEAINSFRKWRPLAKLLDEYNWVIYSQE